MLLVENGSPTAISAYFYMHITSDPIGRQPVQLSDYLFAFGYGPVFWLLVLLRAKLHGSGDRQADIRKVAKLAKLIAPITALNLCGCLLAQFMKLPLLVRFLVFFQVSVNQALLLIWAFWSLKKCTIVPDAHTQQQQKWSPEPQAVRRFNPSQPHIVSHFKNLVVKVMIVNYWSRILVNRYGSGASGSGGGSEGGDSGSDSDVGWDRGASGSGHGSGASGSGGGSEGGDSGSDGGWDRGASGSGHGSGASGSGGGNEGGDRGRDGGGGDLECGVRGTNTEQGFKSSKISEMSLMLTAQTTSTLIGFHVVPTPSSSSKAFLVVALMDQLVAYLCGLTSIMLKSSNKPEAAEIFEKIGFVCTALGFILMVAMFVPWKFVLIAVLLFGVVWFFLFGNDWKTNLKRCIVNLKNFIGMQSD